MINQEIQDQWHFFGLMVTIRDILVLSIIVLVIILVPDCLNLLNLGRFVEILLQVFHLNLVHKLKACQFSRRNAPEKNRYQHNISLNPIEHHFGKFPSNLSMDDFLDVKKTIFHIQQQIQNLFLHLPKNQFQV